MALMIPKTIQSTLFKISFALLPMFGGGGDGEGACYEPTHEMKVHLNILTKIWKLQGGVNPTAWLQLSLFVQSIASMPIAWPYFLPALCSSNGASGNCGSDSSERAPAVAG